MSEVTVACERLALSRDRLRNALRASAAAPVKNRTPLHLAGIVAKDAIDAAVQPLAQRNPIGMVLGAALAGGMLMWSRPWRWLFTPALLATLLPQLASKAFSNRAQVPWFKLLSSLTRSRHKPDAGSIDLRQ